MNNSFNEQLRAMLSGAGSDPGAVPGAVPPSPGIPAQGGAQPGDEMTMRGNTRQRRRVTRRRTGTT